MIFTLNFHEFLHTVYTYVPNSVVKISMMFAKYFEYYTIILRGGAFFRGHAVQVSVIFRPYGRKSSVIIRYFPSVRTEIYS